MPVSEDILLDHEKLKNEVEELADQAVYASEDLMGIEIALEEAKEELKAFEKEHREEL